MSAKVHVGTCKEFEYKGKDKKGYCTMYKSYFYDDNNSYCRKYVFNEDELYSRYVDNDGIVYYIRNN